MDLNALMSTMLSEESIENLGVRAEASPDQVRGGLGSALPLLLNGANAQATNQDTASGFLGALQQHAQDDASNVGSFLGGVILPGVVTSYDALSTRTSLLPHVRLQTPPRVIGRNTNDSMRSGAVFGTAAIVDGVTDRIEKEIGCPVKVIITGGLGREIAGQCLHPNVYDNELLLEGLRLIWEKNLRTPAEKNE